MITASMAARRRAGATVVIREAASRAASVTSAGGCTPLVATWQARSRSASGPAPKGAAPKPRAMNRYCVIFFLSCSRLRCRWSTTG
jgi:hypothetical protein